MFVGGFDDQRFKISRCQKFLVLLIADLQYSDLSLHSKVYCAGNNRKSFKHNVDKCAETPADFCTNQIKQATNKQKLMKIFLTIQSSQIKSYGKFFPQIMNLNSVGLDSDR